MNNIKEKIRETLMTDEFSTISSKTKDEIIEKLFIYHEELIFQNEELNRVNSELEAIKSKFKKLFHEAPISYIFMNEKLEIIDRSDETATDIATTELAMLEYTNRNYYSRSK